MQSYSYSCVVPPTALHFYYFSFTKNWFIVLTTETDLPPTNLSDDHQLMSNVPCTCFFNSPYIPWKIPPWEQGAIHIRKLFCWSLPTTTTSAKRDTFLLPDHLFVGELLLSRTISGISLSHKTITDLKLKLRTEGTSEGHLVRPLAHITRHFKIGLYVVLDLTKF